MLLNFLFLLFINVLHPFYISVTEVNHNAKTKTVEISAKIFFDDLEHQIEKDNYTSFDIINPKDKAKVNTLIAAYLKKHLQIKLNGKSVPMNYLGYEIQEDAAWCYLEIPKINKVSQITVFNDVLFELRSEQINMLNVTVAGKRQSTKLDVSDFNASFSF